jgi:O-antigen/teichoic acid export membrane protein
MKGLGSVKVVSLIWLGSILGAGCAFVTQTLLARGLGPDTYGTFSAALGMVVLLAPLAGFGLSGFWLNIFAKESWGATRWLPGSFRLAAVTTAMITILLLLWARYGPHDSLTMRLLYILPGYLLGHLTVELVSAKLQLEERYFSLAILQFIPHLARLFVVAILMVINISVFRAEVISLLYTFIALSLFVFGVCSIRHMPTDRFCLKGHGVRPIFFKETASPAMLDVAKRSWPFGVTGLFYLVYFQSAIILLKYISSDYSAGLYSVAFFIISAVYLLPSVIYQKFLLPKIHRWAVNDIKQLYVVYRTGALVMLILGSVAMVVTWLLASWGVKLLFGGEYNAAIPIVLALAIAIPARFLASSVGAALSTDKHVIKKIYIMASAALINVSLNFALIPIHGVYGAAVSAIITEYYLLIVLHLYARRYIFSCSKRE